MPLRVSNIRLGLDEPEASLPDHLALIFDVPAASLGPWRILRKSLDARDKDHIGFVYSVEVILREDERKIWQRAGKVRFRETRADLYTEPAFVMPEPGTRPLAHRPVVIG
jgi:uncharacterized FAD-dependent dehydrogenase